MTEKDIRSILENKAVTPSTRQPWQEFLDRIPTVPASKALEAAPALEGFAGSWAASYTNGFGSQTEFGSAQAANTPVRVNKLGQPGLPEINFVPYSHGTNRFGVKGPSLLGHPISFSIVGPTLKSPYTTWQWIVTDNSAGPGGDTLEIDAADSVLGGPPAMTTVGEAYGITTVGDYNGGLYLVISQTGSDGELDGGSIGGLGDGFIAPGVNNSPLLPFDETSKFEIFRIVDITAGVITLDPAKRLASYFTFPGGGDTPVVRGITIFQPKATRLVAIPGSGPTTGRERVFVAVPPETGANSDLLPPYGSAILSNTWLGGGVDPYDPNNVLVQGLAATYNEDVPLPVPVPLETRTARAESNVAPNVGNVPALGYQTLVDLSGNISSDDVGRLIRIFRAETQGTVVFPVSPYDGSPGVTAEDFFGWYEINGVDLINSRYVLRRVTEVDPNSGRISYGLGTAYIVDAASSANAQVTFTFTIHESVSSLFLGGFNADKVSAARLTNLIDPSWTERSAKTPGLVPGISPARPDRAIFDTSVSVGGDFANPGSLLDLGFRMVLFPAQEVAGVMVPNFDRPIDSREVVLDPGITDQSQYITVDYSAGTVALSHAPDPGAGCDVAPDGIISTPDNPRGELVLYASFVPYSMEEGQKGASIRVTGSNVPVNPLSPPNQVDVFSERIIVAVQPSQTVTCGTGVGQVLDLDLDGGALPETGFFDLIEGGLDSFGAPAFVDGAGQRASTFGYVSKSYPGGLTRLHGVYGGGVAAATLNTGTFLGEYSLVLRRDVLPTRVNFPTVPYQQDSSYGSAKRSSTVRFLHSQIIAQPDGSLTVDVDGRGTSVLSELFRSWVLSGGEVTATAVALNNNVIDIPSTTVLFQGQKYILDAGTLGPFLNAALTSTDYYVYADSTNNLVYDTVSALPLPEEDDILIAKVTVPSAGFFSAGPLDVIDLRSILAKVDKRWDIVVGTFPNGWAGYNVPHFETLGEAVAYASEIMSPTGTGSDSGPQITIKVLGGTLETQPIAIRADGIKIEGATRAEGVSGDDTTMAIRWAFDGPLFLLNGHADLVFRDLYFYFDNAAPAVPPGPSRYVFFNQIEGCERLVIDNCTATGTLLQGFFYSSYSGVLPPVRIVAQDAHITRNNVTASDFGIWVENGSQFAHCRIENNRFIGTGLPVTNISGGAVYVNPSNPAASDNIGNHFRGNHVGSVSGAGFFYGIVAYGREDVISENYITQTSREGIIVACAGDRPIISSNHLVNIHLGGNPLWKLSTTTTAPFTVPAVGATVVVSVTNTNAVTPNMYVGQILYFQTGGGYYIITSVTPTTSITVRNLGYSENAAPGTIIAGGVQIFDTFDKEGILATNSSGTGTNYGVFIESNFIDVASSSFVQSNLGVHVVTNTARATVRNNRMTSSSGAATSGIRVASQNSWVDSNLCLNILVTSNSKVTGNVALSLLDDSAPVVGTQVTNNYFDGGIYGANSSDPYEGSSMLFADNQIVGNILVQGTGNLVRGNTVGGLITFTGAGSKFIENTITGSLTAATGTHEIVGNTVGGNIDPGPSSTASDNRVTGHIYVGSTSRISNNAVAGSIRSTAPVTDSQVMNNRATSVIGTGAAGLGGNFQATGCLFTSNTLTGNLNLEGTGNQIHSNILTGYISNGEYCILVGNICNTIRNVNLNIVPPSNTDTHPTGSLAVGNRFGVHPPNRIWGAASRQNDNNQAS